jgi:hypothetical protein
MSDTFESNRPLLAEFQERLGYVEGATGVAVVVGQKVVALDLFDNPATCKKVWKRLLSGVVLDALEAKPSDQVADSPDVAALLSQLQGAPWQENAAVGEGKEYRTDAIPGTHASALFVGDSMLHGSVAVAS